jgi:molecular chaperone GrpE
VTEQVEAQVSVEDDKVVNEEQEAALEQEEVQLDEANESGEDKNWEAEATQLAQQIDEFKDQAIRAKAEVQNVRRRAEQDVEKAHKFALEKFAKELLPIIDGLEKAVEAEITAGNEVTPLREGVEMTLSMFLSGVKKFNLEQIDPVGQPFDPALHEAMSMVPAPDAEPNTVIAAMQKGYTLNGRLVRPAMVIIAKNS